MEDRVRAAAANNAAWCALLCATHDVPSTTDDVGWWAGAAPPAYHPDAVTLVPDVATATVAYRLADRPRASVKDSFDVLDLEEHGYVRLLDGRWIHRSAPDPGATLPAGWQRVTSPAGLATWSVMHGSGHLFRPALLDDPAVAILLGSGSGSAAPTAADAAGAVLNLSDSPGGGSGEVVGVSNVFGPDDAIDAVWQAVVAAAAATYPGRSLVGWESDEDLDGALRAGFADVGPLAVWAR